MLCRTKERLVCCSQVVQTAAVCVLSIVVCVRDQIVCTCTDSTVVKDTVPLSSIFSEMGGERGEGKYIFDEAGKLCMYLSQFKLFVLVVFIFHRHDFLTPSPGWCLRSHSFWCLTAKYLVL